MNPKTPTLPNALGGAFHLTIMVFLLEIAYAYKAASELVSARHSQVRHGTSDSAGKNFVRNDSESPEDTAAGNIAKAQQSSGNAFDSIKCAALVQLHSFASQPPHRACLPFA